MIRTILIVLVIAALLVGGWWMAKSRPLPVDVATVVRGPIRAFVEEEGKTRVIDRFVVSAPVGGRLLRLHLEPGDVVAKAVVVAHIDPLPLQTLVDETRARIDAVRERIRGVGTKKPKQAELEQAENLEYQAVESLAVARNELERAQVELERARKDLARTESLVRDRTLPPAELDHAVAAEGEARERVEAQEVRIKIARLAIGSAKLRRVVLEAQLHDFDWEAKEYEKQISALEASLQKLEDDLDRAEIQAPVAGTILRLHRESEQVVAAGTPLFEIGDLDALEVEVDFLSEDAARMQVGMKAELFGRALGERVIPATIDRIHPSAFTKISSLGVEQQRVKVILAFDAEGSGLGDLHRIEVRVILEERGDVLLVSEGSLFRQDRRWHVFRVDGDAAHLQAVETGLRDGKDREVLGGLDEGAVVILHPDDTIEDGVRVEMLAGGAHR